ncbi:16885_t:CDS:2 [Cetraspora pellucida]|uniref:16885_t:CDS:1 n=1 Tax=Cetraspora pellucida TaxID=1433469 RepID=A0A9N9HRF9_9GLOM|nr:16885_t:CDS:2 [Cetraspora pellucida]
MVTYDLLETADQNTKNGLPEFLVSEDAIFFLDSVTTNRARDVSNMNYNPIELAHQMKYNNRNTVTFLATRLYILED